MEIQLIQHHTLHTDLKHTDGGDGGGGDSGGGGRLHHYLIRVTNTDSHDLT